MFKEEMMAADSLVVRQLWEDEMSPRKSSPTTSAVKGIFYNKVDHYNRKVAPNGPKHKTFQQRIDGLAVW